MIGHDRRAMGIVQFPWIKTAGITFDIYAISCAIIYGHNLWRDFADGLGRRTPLQDVRCPGATRRKSAEAQRQSADWCRRFLFILMLIVILSPFF